MRPRTGPEAADGGRLNNLTLHPGALSLEELQRVHAGGLQLDSRCRGRRRPSPPARRWCSVPPQGQAAVYGVNTGFGKLASTRISEADLATLQLNLIRSHSVGVGAPLVAPVVRLMLALKAASLARGHSGVRPVVIDTLLAVHNAGLVPYVPSQGSVGASGDLAPLAHMTLALMGEGEMLIDGKRKTRRRRAAPGRHRTAGAAGQGRAGADQRHPDLDRAGAACAVRVRAGARGRAGDRRADRRRRARQRRPVRSAHPRAARPARARSTWRSTTARCWQASPSAPRTSRATTACRTRTACAASRRWWAPAWTSCAMPRWCCCARPMPSPTTRWCLPRTGAMLICGGNFHAEPVALAADAHGAGHRRGRRDRRAPHRDADRRRRLAPAAVPDRRRRAEQRLHDRPRHGGRAGEREQVAGAPGQRRQPADQRRTRRTMSRWPPSPRAACRP